MEKMCLTLLFLWMTAVTSTWLEMDGIGVGRVTVWQGAVPYEMPKLGQQRPSNR